RRGDRRRDPGRARPLTRSGGSPARRHLLGGRARQHRRVDRGDGLDASQAGLRDGGRPRAGHARPYSAHRRRAPAARIHDHRAGGRPAARGRGEDRPGTSQASLAPKEALMAGKMVEFPSNGGKTSGYLATPTSGKGPGVLVIQEWWGLVQHIKNVCDRFAAEGFTAPAPLTPPSRRPASRPRSTSTRTSTTRSSTTRTRPPSTRRRPTTRGRKRSGSSDSM